MKKIFLLLVTVAIFSACTQQVEQRYFSSSPEIDLAKAVMQSYLNSDWDTYRSFYADTAKIAFNVTEENAVSVDAVIEQHMLDVQSFSSIETLPKPEFYEMVITDNGEKWVNYWGVWVGTLAANGQRFEVPLHITSRFVDGKIVEEHGFWNNAAIMMATMALNQPE
jgi:ketosteroid isomerase-like protein